MTEQEQLLEKQIQDKGLTHPRITPKDLDDNIKDIEIVKFISKSGKILRWAVITTSNGFAVVGKPSVAVSAENDDEEIGEKIAIENSREEMWLPMGYELHSRLFSKSE